jgi:hypothetical protein
MDRCLGRLPHDPAALARAPSLAVHRFAAMPPPPRLDRSAIEFQPGLYGNDHLPDCSAAGLANAAGMVYAINTRSELAINPDKVPLFYAQCVGCEPTDAAMMATDGAVLLDVLMRQWQSGFDVGLPVKLVGIPGVLPLKRPVLASAMTRLGHAYLGVTLLERDMEQAAVWDVQPGRDDGAVVGGHCLVGWDFGGLGDGDTIRLATWGGWQPATWQWLAARLDEAHACVWRGLAANTGVDIGVDADALEATLQSFAAA